MLRDHRPSPLVRAIAVVLCLTVAVFFSALLLHTHGAGQSPEHASHCQVCALGHTAASTVSALVLAVTLQMLMLLHAGAPKRGSPQLAVVHTTRPPPACR